MTHPLPHEMRIMALGNSVSTDGVLQASVVVVNSFSELDDLQDNQVNTVTSLVSP